MIAGHIVKKQSLTGFVKKSSEHTQTQTQNMERIVTLEVSRTVLKVKSAVVQQRESET